MEDGIENLSSSFSERLTREINNGDKTIHSVQATNNLYVYIPKNEDTIPTNNTIISNCILFDNIEKIMEHSKHNTGQIAIFTKDTTGAYKFSNLQ
jgi:hypothetical protein